MLARTSPLRRLTAVGLVFAILAGGCSIVLTAGRGCHAPGSAARVTVGSLPASAQRAGLA